jgi:hypothetical protein
VLVGGEGKKAALVTSGAYSGEHAGRAQLVCDCVEHVFIGIAGCVVEEIKKFPDLSGCEYNTEQLFFFGRRCHGV